MTAAAIRRLTLTNFRSYHAASLDIGGNLVVLTGPNGAGKTNLIEAISFLAPGRGLAPRHASRRSRSPKATAPGRSRRRSKACSASPRSAPASSRRPARTRHAPALCRIDREPVGSAAAFADHLRVIWLTPAMDQLFVGPASERRRFLDRLVLAVDAEHSEPRLGARARAALAQPAAGGPAPRSALARRDRARDRRACGRGRGAARRDRAPPAGRAGEPQGRRLPVRRDRARRLDGAAAAGPSRRRDRGPLSRRAQGQPRRATPPPAARSTARTSPTSR